MSTKKRVRYKNKATRDWLRDKCACRGGRRRVGGQTLSEAFRTTHNVYDLCWLLERVKYTDTLTPVWSNWLGQPTGRIKVPSNLSCAQLRAWATSHGAYIPLGV